MNTLGSYKYPDMQSAVAIKDNIVLGKNYRISILSDRLIRLEYNESGKFIDRPSMRVIFRKFPKVDYKVMQSETLIQIVGKIFTIDYVKEKSFIGSKVTPGNTLKITINGTNRSWFYNHPEAKNLGTINYSLDNFKGKLKLSHGLYSLDGFSFIDDSNSMILDDSGNFVKRTSSGLDFYVFIYNNDLGQCLKDYYLLTGYPMLIPRYALGNWWYKDTKYTNESFRNIITKFKEEDIPLSVFAFGNNIHSDNDFFSFDRASIDVNYAKNILNANNIKMGLYIDPSLNINNNSVYYSSIASMIGNVNNYSFLPFDSNKINIYSLSVLNFLVSNGIDATIIGYNSSNDVNTLALLNQYHYAMDGLKSHKRGVILVRNHNIGIHRYGIVLSGKTNVDWETLNILPKYNSSASNMGISYIVNPIGGFYNGIENFELYIRYIQFGVFSSLLVLASDDGKYYRREPWRWNSSENEIIKKFLKLRNKIIPYLYTEAYSYHALGSPIIQPLYYKYPKIVDEPLYSNEYFFGTSMLVCPITKKKNIVMNRVVQRLFIPEGIWYEFESGKKYLGNKYYMSFYRDEDYPVFCKAGSIIPLSLDNNYDNPVNLEFDVFPGASGSYNLYEDDGISDSYDSVKGSFLELKFNYSNNLYEFSIHPTSTADYIPSMRNYFVKFRNTNSAVVSVTDGINALPAKAYMDRNDLVVSISNVSCGRDVIVSCKADNLENSSIKVINDDIYGILLDLDISTLLKQKIDDILFSDMPIRKKRIGIRKLKRKGLETKFIKMFLNLLEYIKTV